MSWDMEVWILLALATALFNAAWGAMGKGRMKELSPLGFSFLLRLVAVVCFIPLAILYWEPADSATFWHMVVLNGLSGVPALYFLMKGVKSDFYSAYSLRNTAPLFVFMLAVAFLAEPASLLLTLAVLLVIAGAFFFYRAKSLSWWGLASAICYAFANVFSKVGVSHGNEIIFAFFSFTVTTSLSGLVLWWEQGGKKTVHEIKTGFIKMIPLGFFSFLATIFYYTALPMAPVSQVVVVARANLLFGFLFSYFLLAEKAGWKNKLVGAACIGASLILIAIQ